MTTEMISTLGLIIAVVIQIGVMGIFLGRMSEGLKQSSINTNQRFEQINGRLAEIQSTLKTTTSLTHCDQIHGEVNRRLEKLEAAIS